MTKHPNDNIIVQLWRSNNLSNLKYLLEIYFLYFESKDYDTIEFRSKQFNKYWESRIPCDECDTSLFIQNFYKFLELYFGIILTREILQMIECCVEDLVIENVNHYGIKKCDSHSHSYYGWWLKYEEYYLKKRAEAQEKYEKYRYYLCRNYKDISEIPINWNNYKNISKIPIN
jgi:hypothetical protein